MSGIYYSLVPLVSFLLSSKTDNSTFEKLEKPKETPPKYVFPIVWVSLYAFISYSAYLAEKTAVLDTTKHNIRLLFTLQFIPILMWSHFFFTNRDATTAMQINIFNIAIAMLLLVSVRHNQTAQMLLLPYIIWLCFALYLTIKIKGLNPEVLS